MNLCSHRSDDKFYQKKRRELKKYLPVLRQHLEKLRTAGNTASVNYTVLHDFSKQLHDSNIRVPMHILLRGEGLLRRDVLKSHEAKSWIVEAVWRSWGFRKAVSKKLDDTIAQYGNTCAKTATEMEDFIYIKSKTKDEYLEYAARIILYLRDNNVKKRLEEKKAELLEKILAANPLPTAGEIAMDLSVPLPIPPMASRAPSFLTTSPTTFNFLVLQPKLQQFLPAATRKRCAPQLDSSDGLPSSSYGRLGSKRAKLFSSGVAQKLMAVQEKEASRASADKPIGSPLN